MGKVSTPADLSKSLRKALGGITQAELATKLLLSRNYISQIEASLKSPSDRVLAQMENMLTQATSTVSKKPRVEMPPQWTVEEHGPQPMVASRLSPTPGAPSTRADCEALFADLLDAAERSGNPNAFPVIHDRLKKKFPLAEWEENPD